MINFVILAMVFIWGLAIGSFINVLIYRLPLEEDIVIKPSHCMKCGQRIKPYDLIPLFSYIFLRGKCRNCGEKISIQYPLIEFFTALIITGTYYKFGWLFPWSIYQGYTESNLILLASMIVLAGMFITTFMIDLKHYIIPNEIIIFGIAAGAVFTGFLSYFKGDWYVLINAGIGFLAGGLTFFLIVILGEWFMKQEAMGMGDVKLMAVVGLFIGWKLTIIAMLMSFMIGSVVSIFLLATKIKGRKDMIPFGPFIILGSVVAIIWGNQIINWYLSVGKFQ